MRGLQMIEHPAITGSTIAEYRLKHDLPRLRQTAEEMFAGLASYRRREIYEYLNRVEELVRLQDARIHQLEARRRSQPAGDAAPEDSLQRVLGVLEGYSLIRASLAPSSRERLARELLAASRSAGDAGGTREELAR